MKYRRLFLPTLLLIFFSCSSPEETSSLADVESYIEERPDSALVVLDSIGKDGIRGRKAKAKHALLYSMALDKNYIDITNDSIINVAVNWYKRHGTADEKLKSYYYQGRVYQNSCDNEMAMKSFIKAEQWVTNTTNHIVAGMLYSAKAGIYNDLFNYDIARNNLQLAANHYFTANDLNKYFNTVISIALNDIILELNNDVQKDITLLKENWNSLNLFQKSGYYSVLLHIHNVEKTDELPHLLNEYLTEIKDSALIDWLYISKSYCNIGEYETAQNCLNIYRELSPEYENSADYHIINATLLDSLDRHSEALKAYRKYIVQKYRNPSVSSLRSNLKNTLYNETL